MPSAIRGPGGSEIAESTSLLTPFQAKDILIGAHKPIATFHLLDQSRNDRLAVEFDPLRPLNPLNDIRDVERLSGAAEYVMHHLNLRRTFSGSPGLRRPGAQALDSLELSFERNLDCVQYSGLDFIFFHGGILPLTAVRAVILTERAYHNRSTSVNKINDLRTENVQTPVPQRGRDVCRRRISGFACPSGAVCSRNSNAGLEHQPVRRRLLFTCYNPGDVHPAWALHTR